MTRIWEILVPPINMFSLMSLCTYQPTCNNVFLGEELYSHTFFDLPLLFFFADEMAIIHEFLT